MGTKSTRQYLNTSDKICVGMWKGSLVETKSSSKKSRQWLGNEIYWEGGGGR